ncbi:MAG: glutamine amidotransferase [Deltaproteobacteria bacterium]|nr:MAG: glutamine amidotransferase [Deltaproteobacteria bacterium]TMB38012.1 MAG: glutamine amidotransferase [Deltaproteobacteria bacterium]
MKRVLVVQHEQFEGPGTLGEALAGLELRFLRTFAGDPIPKTLEEDALVVLGGGMGVYDRDRLPHLNDEIALYAAAMAAAKPVLGICLGSQLLAAALGAAVGKAPRKEIGWYGVSLLPEARGDALFETLPKKFPAFHWHGDAFTLPEGAVPLASSAMTPLQAFRAGPRAWGIQFHLETDEEVLTAMLSGGAAELREVGADTARIRSRAREELPQLRERALAVFRRWAALIQAP